MVYTEEHYFEGATLVGRTQGESRHLGYCHDMRETLRGHTMFDHTHYVPILKGKQGEYASLAEVAFKSNLTPLVELLFEGKDKSKIEQDCSKLMKAWNDPRPFFIDTYLEPNDNGASAAIPMRQYLAHAKKISLRLIPTTGLRRSSAYMDIVRDANVQDKNGVCLRVEPDDLGDLVTLPTRIASTLERLGISESNTDLLIDLKEIPLQQVSVFQMLSVTVLSSIPNIVSWRTLTLAATTFPVSMGSFLTPSISTRQRGEWTIWTAIRSNRALLRKPTFGDYAIANPVITDFDPRIMDMTANIRYTIDGNWLVLKGRGVKNQGYGQFRGICRTLTRRSDYSGSGFSPGDQYIADCAAGIVSTGNMTTWRRVGTTHHLTFVATQIATLPPVP